MTIEERVCPTCGGKLEPFADTSIGTFGPWGCPACQSIEQPTSNPRDDFRIVPVQHQENLALRAEIERLTAENFNLRQALKEPGGKPVGVADETSVKPKVKHETWCASNHLECDCGADYE